MKGPYPRFCEYDLNGFVDFRVALGFSFYLCQPHEEIAPHVMRALEIYLEAVGVQALVYYVGYEEEMQLLDASGWEWVRRKMSSPQTGFAHLCDHGSEQRYRFLYGGQDLRPAPDVLRTGPVNRVNVWLPLEYLEAEGPGRVRELAIALARVLPFSSGHGGLSYNFEIVGMWTYEAIRKVCFRYPGIDIPDIGNVRSFLGTQIDGVHWLNFLGPVVVKLLGGVEALRARLQSPGVSVQEIGDGQALVTLGEWPEAGDIEAGRDLPAYRELARVLEPVLHEETGEYGPGEFSPQDMRRWGRRFLD